MELNFKNSLDELLPPNPESSTLTLVCSPEHYCASEICRAVEDCDAQVINLNVRASHTDEGDMVVSLRVNHRVADAVSRSLERFGYMVASIEQAADSEDMARARQRANELLRYLEI